MFRTNEPFPKETSSLQSDPNNFLVSLSCMTERVIYISYVAVQQLGPDPSPSKALIQTLESWDPSALNNIKGGDNREELLSLVFFGLFLLLFSAHS